MRNSLLVVGVLFAACGPVEMSKESGGTDSKQEQKNRHAGGGGTNGGGEGGGSASGGGEGGGYASGGGQGGGSASGGGQGGGSASGGGQGGGSPSGGGQGGGSASGGGAGGGTQACMPEFSCRRQDGTQIRCCGGSFCRQVGPSPTEECDAIPTDCMQTDGGVDQSCLAQHLKTWWCVGGWYFYMSGGGLHASCND